VEQRPFREIHNRVDKNFSFFYGTGRLITMTTKSMIVSHPNQVHNLTSCLFKINFISFWGTLLRSWLRYYATSRKAVGSVPDEVIEFFKLPKPSRRTMALGSTQPSTEMSTRNLPAGKGQPGHKAGNLTAICWAICLENAGASTSHNTMGLHLPFTGIA
jgi:hypothetical protein